MQWLKYASAFCSFILLMPGMSRGGDVCSLQEFTGSHVGIGVGEVRQHGRKTPSARIYQESWQSNGTLTGTLFRRVGKSFETASYTGTVELHSDCSATIVRKYNGTTWVSSLFLDPLISGGYGIDQDPRSDMTDTVSPQGDSACTVATLKGLVLSSQMGLSKNAGKWIPNAVIQREMHDGAGKVNGLAMINYGKGIEPATYSGQFTVNQDCTGTLFEKDSLGMPYHYQVIIQSSGDGYWYLQTDKNDLTVAHLGRNPVR